MLLSKKISKLDFPSRKLRRLVFVIAFLGFIGCRDNSDKIVAESIDVKQFEVDQIDDDNFNFDTSNLINSVVMVDGVVQDINYLNDRSTIILKGEKTEDRLVICDMQDTEKLKIKNLNLGDVISIKGMLKGTLNDIIILNCIIQQTKTNE